MQGAEALVLVKFRTPLELAVLAVAEMVVRALLVYRVILAWLALQIQVAVVAVAALILALAQRAAAAS